MLCSLKEVLVQALPLMPITSFTGQGLLLGLGKCVKVFYHHEAFQNRNCCALQPFFTAIVSQCM